MTKIIILAIALAIIVAFIEFTRGSEKPDKKKYGYTRKDFIMSRAEHECFGALVTAVRDRYYVFPQIHLSSIVDNKVVGQNWKAAVSHINQKSVDFVLCDKAYLAPKLAIELDDRSHERQDRIDRDGEVERILAEAGLPLLRLENHGKFDPVDLMKKIGVALS